MVELRADARRNLERRVLKETGAVIADPDTHAELRNLLEGVAIAGGTAARLLGITT